ncbi:hypothetical protein [Bifidobacterium longum]|nr:hypothetical protein [Bifidobacterium longum]
MAHLTHGTGRRRTPTGLESVAARGRDMLEARWREESAGSVGEESHESA